MEDQGIHEPLQWMFEKAWANRLWFYSSYGRLWFSPNELEKANRKGRFRRGPINWVLRDPQERILELMLEREKALEEIESIHRRVQAEKSDGAI